MKIKSPVFSIIFALLCSFNMYASGKRQTEVQNVLMYVDWVKNNEYTTYADYENELNFDTIDSSVKKESDAFSSYMIEYTKKTNLYCTEIYLDGIKDRLLAMMQIDGSAQVPYLTFFRFDSSKQKWVIYYENDGIRGDCGLVFPVSHPTKSNKTLFLQVEENFDNKRLASYSILSFKNKKWKTESKVSARYIYNLTDEEKEWISSDIIEKMASFDYSFIGIKGDHPPIIEHEVNDKKIIAKPYYTSVGYFPSNYLMKVCEKTASDEDDALLYLGTQWGFNIVTKDNKDYLVYIGMGEKPGEPCIASIEDFMLNVIDLSALKVVFRSYIKSEIVFE